MMIHYLTGRRRPIALSCCALFLFQLLQPAVSFALTSGPTQPEVQSFQPAGTTEMVDLFSGDFSYNIPLFELPGPNGGYPFNLSYQAGIGMDQEASWVGLGWSLNPGAITRQMRGLPDEFRGDDIKTKMSVKPSVTVGLGAGGTVELFGADGLSLNAGFSVSQNNYKGMGYSIDGSLGYQRAAGGGMTGGIGIGFSLDSKEGVSLQPSLTLAGKVGSVGLDAGYNSKSGLSSISLTHSASSLGVAYKDKKDKDRTWKNSISNSTALWMAHPGYTPQITMPMKNLNLSAEFKLGGSWWGVFGNLYVRGFYNEQRLDQDGRSVTADAYGYMNYQYATDPKALLDFNREKDGMVTKESPNLGIPSLTYDIYSVTGQGISAMYRPMRNDYGIIHDQEVSSVSNGGSVGVDVGPAATHVGVNLSVNHSKSTSGPWRKNNDLIAPFKFQSKTVNNDYEPWYFKVHGEPNTEPETVVSKLGGDKAVQVGLSHDRSDPTAVATIENKSWGIHDAPASATENRQRKSRNQVVQPLTNEQLLKGEVEIMPQFRITYLNEAGLPQTLNRSAYPSHHLAAYTALTPEGLRYNYGIPAYNHRHEEVTFSAQGSTAQVSRVAVHDEGTVGEGDPKFKHATETDEFLKSVEIPRYAHAHLLTSILGPDYVDLTDDGVTDDDLGYWVKFTYQRTTSNYKWRDPFSAAHYQQGWITDPRDDKGSFTYGEKELWYLVKAETKSHVADFHISNADRADGKGVLHKIQHSDNNTGPAVHKLTEIRLYTRLAGAATPLKIVKFSYDQSLCQGLYGEGSTGKLTLKELRFLYGGSNKGELNPYRFTYSSTNPVFDNLAYDRWGNYKPYPPQQYDHNRDFPYVPQSPADKTGLDANASAWSLTGIDLPSGGKIIVDYETDDYAYVQHKPAMQMTEIVDPENFTGASFSLKDDLLKIRFKLESPVDGAITDADLLRAEVLKYLDTKRNHVYFKLRLNLRGSGENFHETICGYANIDPAGPMGLEKDGTDPEGNYTHGYFHVAAEEGNGNNVHHPFSMRAWQHLRVNQPELANSGRKLEQTDNEGERIDQIKSLGGIGAHVRQMFQGFYRYCRDKGWGREVITAKSWIRLNSPDKIKYGGGLRVKQITMKDQWSEDEEGIYGQVYEYTMEEGGKTISSGVASYEPMVGGDENALRYAKKYVQSVSMRSDNNLFFEYPINESYYPGPQVGYRKVTVWSLAAASLAGKNVKNIPADLFPHGTGISYGTTGKTEHEFFTAKDFPVITDETEKVNRPYKLAVPIPFVGNISVSKLSTSQGYSIVTNDMHGKPKMISNYRQDKGGKTEPAPISWVRYNYLSEQRVYDQERVNVLVNVLKENTDNTLSFPAGTGDTKVVLGQETEFFTDMRQYEDNTWTGGVRINTDVVYIPIVFVVIPIPIPTVWPSISKSQNQLRMAVTNKVIFKAGILQSTEAYDGGSTVVTRNEKWDKLTGAPVLTRTNNNFDAPVYSYSIPAYSQYQGMGAAYQNVGLSFEISSVVKDPYRDGYHDFYINAQMSDALHPGDEVILYEPADELNKPLAHAVYTGSQGGDNILYTKEELSLRSYRCLIVRSGFRNQLAVSAGTITGLRDPSVKGTPIMHPKTITIVK